MFGNINKNNIENTIHLVIEKLSELKKSRFHSIVFIIYLIMVITLLFWYIYGIHIDITSIILIYLLATFLYLLIKGKTLSFTQTILLISIILIVSTIFDSYIISYIYYGTSTLLYIKSIPEPYQTILTLPISAIVIIFVPSMFYSIYLYFKILLGNFDDFIDVLEENCSNISYNENVPNISKKNTLFVIFGQLFIFIFFLLKGDYFLKTGQQQILLFKIKELGISLILSNQISNGMLLGSLILLGIYLFVIMYFLVKGKRDKILRNLIILRSNHSIIIYYAVIILFLIIDMLNTQNKILSLLGKSIEIIFYFTLFFIELKDYKYNDEQTNIHFFYAFYLTIIGLFYDTFINNFVSNGSIFHEVIYAFICVTFVKNLYKFYIKNKGIKIELPEKIKLISGSYECSTCNKKFKYLRGLNDHKKAKSHL